MFRKVLIAAMFATAAGYCFAATNVPQSVTSQVFYDQERYVDEVVEVDTQPYARGMVMRPSTNSGLESNAYDVPAWPLVGSDADVEVGCKDGLCSKKTMDETLRIVSKVGPDLVVENNFNLGTRGEFLGWSGGANMLHGNQIPVGFDDECNTHSEMPLLHREVLEDDGGSVLAVSRGGRKNCGRYADTYEGFAARNNMKVTGVTADGKTVTTVAKVSVGTMQQDMGGNKVVALSDGQGDMMVVAENASRIVEDPMGEKVVAVRDQNGEMMYVPSDVGQVIENAAGETMLAIEDKNGQTVVVAEDSGMIVEDLAGNRAIAFTADNGDVVVVTEETVVTTEETLMAVNESADAEAPVKAIDQVRSWVVANGQTLREVLQSWCDKEGWDLVWTTPREYPIEASAVFKGRFVDVASALVRNFGRATPIPYAKFYKGNRVLVISTTEE